MGTLPGFLPDTTEQQQQLPTQQQAPSQPVLSGGQGIPDAMSYNRQAAADKASAMPEIPAIEPPGFLPKLLATIAAFKGNFGPGMMLLEQERKTKLYDAYGKVAPKIQELEKAGKLEDAQRLLINLSAAAGDRAPELIPIINTRLQSIGATQQKMQDARATFNLFRDQLGENDPRQHTVDALEKSMARGDVLPEEALRQFTSHFPLSVNTTASNQTFTDTMSGQSRTQPLPSTPAADDYPEQVRTRMAGLLQLPGLQNPTLSPDEITNIRKGIPVYRQTTNGQTINITDNKTKALVAQVGQQASQEHYALEVGKNVPLEPRITTEALASGQITPMQAATRNFTGVAGAGGLHSTGQQIGQPADQSTVQAAMKMGVNPKTVLALLGTEGSADTAISGKGAASKFQLMPETARPYLAAMDPSFKTADAKVIQQVLKSAPDIAQLVALQHIKDLQNQFGDNPQAIAAAYFSGKGNVRPDGSVINPKASDGNVDVNGYLERFNQRFNGLSPTQAQPNAVQQAISADVQRQKDIATANQQAQLNVPVSAVPNSHILEIATGQFNKKMTKQQAFDQPEKYAVLDDKERDKVNQIQSLGKSLNRVASYIDTLPDINNPLARATHFIKSTVNSVFGIDANMTGLQAAQAIAHSAAEQIINPGGEKAVRYKNALAAIDSGNATKQSLTAALRELEILMNDQYKQFAVDASNGNTGTYLSVMPKGGGGIDTAGVGTTGNGEPPKPQPGIIRGTGK